LGFLEDAGVVGPANGIKPRDILVTEEQLEGLLNSLMENPRPAPASVKSHSTREKTVPAHLAGSGRSFRDVVDAANKKARSGEW